MLTPDPWEAIPEGTTDEALYLDVVFFEDHVAIGYFGFDLEDDTLVMVVTKETFDRCPRAILEACRNRN